MTYYIISIFFALAAIIFCSIDKKCFNALNAILYYENYI